MNKLTIIITGLLLGLFIWGLCEAHETHLSDIGQQTHVSISPCPELSGYMVESKERGCFLIYKQRDLAHSAMHVQDMDQDGDCSCPSHDNRED